MGAKRREPVRLVGRQRPGRTDVENQPIGDGSIVDGVAGELGSHRREGEETGALESGVRDLARHRIMRGNEFANLGQSEEPMVLRVAPSDAVEQVDVLG